MFELTLPWFPCCSHCHLYLDQVEEEHHWGGAAAFCIILCEDAQSVLQFHPPKPGHLSEGMWEQYLVRPY